IHSQRRRGAGRGGGSDTAIGGGGGEASTVERRGPAALTAPWATTSSGCSITVGAVPSCWCSRVATIGIRVEPPTRNSPAASPGRRPAPASVDAVIATARDLWVRLPRLYIATSGAP